MFYSEKSWCFVVTFSDRSCKCSHGIWQVAADGLRAVQGLRCLHGGEPLLCAGCEAQSRGPWCQDVLEIFAGEADISKKDIQQGLRVVQRLNSIYGRSLTSTLV